MEIISDRILLLPLSLEYKEPIFREFTPEITVFMSPTPPEKIEDTEKFILSTLEKMENGEEMVFAILEKETKEFLGCAGFHNMSTQAPEMGIWIKKSAHGNGYGKEALEAVKKWADEKVDYLYISYPVAKDNSASRKIAESMGGKLVREFIGKKQDGMTFAEVDYRIYKTN